MKNVSRFIENRSKTNKKKINIKFHWNVIRGIVLFLNILMNKT